jgi:hypothetical protein
MKKLILTATAALVFTAGVTAIPMAASAQVFVRIGPPPPVREVAPPPRPGFVWRSGYHRWDGARYVWVPGEYIEEHPGHHWVNGHWAHRPGGYVWIEGHWR